ncbi:MAG: SDR family oxidoreductase [Candidatus Promineifilaceae bacterium]
MTCNLPFAIRFNHQSLSLKGYNMTNIFISGANRGIGLALTTHFLAEGARVFAACRQPAKARALNEMSNRHGDLLTVLAMDVTDEASVREGVTAVTHHTSHIDILINNAGVLHPGETLQNFDTAKMRHTFAVNVIGAMCVTVQCLPLLRQSSQPRILNISSQLGSLQGMARNNWGTYSYNSSKAALNMLTLKLAHDLRPDGVTAVAIHPGWVQTDMGGPNATVTPTASAQGIAAIANRLTLADSGKFYVYNGEEHPW